jgi:hypothetical protein
MRYAMPKEKHAITAEDISVFVDRRDDMALEIFTYRTLREAGWWANHGGFYRDTVQDKFRQFDVQGGLDLSKNPNTPRLPKTGIRIAAECKNIDPEVPIVVSRMPRADSESYHCLLKKVESVQEVRVIRSTAVHAKPYHPGDPVGKSILQYQKNPEGQSTRGPVRKVVPSIVIVRDVDHPSQHPVTRRSGRARPLLHISRPYRCRPRFVGR